MIAMTLGLFISVIMLNYFAKTIRTTKIQRADTTIAAKGQMTISLLSRAVREAGSGSLVNSDVPFYSGTCGAWTPCTANGTGQDPDRMAVLMNPEHNTDCTNTVVPANNSIVNVYYIQEIDGISSLFCRGLDENISTWNSPAVPLIDGVENLQVLYRVADSLTNIQHYKSADQIPPVNGSAILGWDRIRGANISVLVSNATGLPTPSTPDNQSFQLADATPMVFNDNILRRVFSVNEIIYSKMDQ